MGRPTETRLPVTVTDGQVELRPPLLFNVENPDGLLLEEILEQLIGEMQDKQQREPCRETALVITHLETALLWQLRRGMNRGTVQVRIADPAAG